MSLFDSDITKIPKPSLSESLSVGNSSEKSSVQSLWRKFSSKETHLQGDKLFGVIKKFLESPEVKKMVATEGDHQRFIRNVKHLHQTGLLTYAQSVVLESEAKKLQTGHSA